ncbi:MAG: type II secretion system protein [Verrucomicrobiales bacterium]|nr:type II secretion system protein [Verrucomicrobiales bacterium]
MRRQSKSGPTPCRAAASTGGFTLIELLVVMAIIGILASLVLGAVGQGRFRGKVTQCVSNYRQWGIAVNLYASDDGRDRLPAFALPLSEFKSYRDLHPWFVALEMGTNMAPYGLVAPMWFCPARTTDSLNANLWFQSTHGGRNLTSMEDLTEYWLWQTKFFAGIGHSWFVPRPLRGSTEVYPDPKIVTTPDGISWPSRTSDPSAGLQPILTDLTIGTWNDTRTEFNVVGTGHAWPFLVTRNINVLFVDGHVETRPKKTLKWRINSSPPDDHLIPY